MFRKQPVPSFPAPEGWKFDPGEDKDPLSTLSAAVLDLPRLLGEADNLPHLKSADAVGQAAKWLTLQSFKVESLLDGWYQSDIRPMESMNPMSKPNFQVSTPTNPDTVTWKAPAPRWYDGLSGLSDAYTMNTYRNYRIHVYQVRLQSCKVLSRLEITDVSMRNLARSWIPRSVEALSLLCDEICSTIPFHLQNPTIPPDLGEAFIVLPLMAASSVDELPIKQKAYINNQLHRIAFSEREKTGPGRIFDARIATRMVKFTNLPAVVK